MTIAATNSVIRIKIASPGRHRKTGRIHQYVAVSLQEWPAQYGHERAHASLSVDEVAQPLSRPLDDLANPIAAIVLRGALRCQGDLRAHRNCDGR